MPNPFIRDDLGRHPAARERETRELYEQSLSQLNNPTGRFRISYHYSVEKALASNMSPTSIRRAVSRGVGKAATQIARIWRVQSKALCPVRTGSLKRSLTTTRKRIRRRGPDSFRIEIGPRGILKGTSRQHFYFYILISRWYVGQGNLSFIERAFLKEQSKFRRILFYEIWDALRVEWTRRAPAGVVFPLGKPSDVT